MRARNRISGVCRALSGQMAEDGNFSRLEVRRHLVLCGGDIHVVCPERHDTNV